VKTLPDNLFLALIVVAVGGFIGSGLGTKKLGNPGLKILLAVVLVIAGVKLIFL
jgi:uncharacterized membrane protein YfcA